MTKTNLDDAYSAALLGFTNAALLYLAINGYHRKSKLFQTKKLNLWLKLSIKQKRFPIVIRRDLLALQKQSEKTNDSISTIESINKQLCENYSEHGKLSYQLLFDVFQGLELKQIRTEFLEQVEPTVKITKDARQLWMQKSELDVIERQGTAIRLYMVGDIEDAVFRAFTDVGLSCEITESNTDLQIKTLRVSEGNTTA